MTKKKDAYKELNKVLAKRKYCNNKCRYFDSCPFQSLSESCTLAAYSEKVRRRFISLFMSEEEGLVEELRRSIFLYGAYEADTAADGKPLQEYINMLFKLHKSMYGSKDVDEQTPEINVQIRRVEHKDTTEEEILEVEEDEESLLNSDIVNELFMRGEHGKD